MARTEEMKQAFRNEPRRCMDHGHKRATEQDRYPSAAAAVSISAQQENEEEQEEVMGRATKQQETASRRGAITEV